MRTTLAAGALLLLLSGSSQANPWTRDRGGFYANLSYARIAATSYYGPGGSKVAIPSYTQQTVSLYAEVGLYRRWVTAVLEWQALRRGELAGGGAISGVGDLRLGVASGLLVHPLRVTAIGIAGIPLGDPAPLSPAVAPALGRSLPTGAGDFYLEWRLEAGHSLSLGPIGLYGIAGLGYRKRGIANRQGSDPAPGTRRNIDEFVVTLELGARVERPVVDRIWLVGRLNTLGSLASTAEVVPSFSGLRDGTQYVAYGVALDGRVYRGLHLGGQLDGAFSARSVPAGAQLKAYVAWER